VKHLVEPVGFVSNSRKDLSDDYWGNTVSEIRLDPTKFQSEAIQGLEAFSHVELIFLFDQVSEDSVFLGASHPRENKSWPKVGIFAQRKKNRPNRLGLTTARVIKVEGSKLTVSELDAVDGTPILDIKPTVREFTVDKESIRQPDWMTELMQKYFESKE
jgi:tRNA (adenine37-N6)-methyltransferase